MTSTSLRAVLFDFDGTLGYYRPTHLDLYVEVARAHGVEVTLEALRGAVEDAWAPWETEYGVDHSAHSGDEAAFNAIRAELHRGRYASAGVQGEAAVLEAIARELCAAESDPVHFALFEDSVPALERVRHAGLAAYIVSNHIWRLPEVISALGLSGGDGGALVAGTLTSARVGYRKPHPRIFEAALRLAGCEAGEALYVGDNIAHDIEGARAVGMHAVLIDRGGTKGYPGAVRSLLEIPLVAPVSGLEGAL